MPISTDPTPGCISTVCGLNLKVLILLILCAQNKTLLESLNIKVMCGLIQISLTSAAVEADLCFEDIISREVNSVTGEAEMAAYRCFWMQL